MLPLNNRTTLNLKSCSYVGFTSAVIHLLIQRLPSKSAEERKGSNKNDDFIKSRFQISNPKENQFIDEIDLDFPLWKYKI